MAAVRNSTGENIVIQSPEITSSSSIHKRSCEIQRRLNFPLCRPNVRPLQRSFRQLFPMAEGDDSDVQLHRHRNSRSCPTNNRRVDSVSTQVGSTRFALLSVVVIFLCSLLALFYVYTSFPNLDKSEKQYIKLPWDIEEAKNLGLVLDKYKDRYFFEVLSGIFVTYIFLQTFAIPGSLFLSILSGFLFPFLLALILVCVCSAIGASLCYLLSQLLGRRLVKKFFPERARKWAITVDKHQDNIFNYILFLRMTPFLPNWFINLTAPVIGVPLVPFALGTFIGVGPPSFVAIQAGRTLHKMSSSSGVFSWSSVILLGAFALLSLVPVLLKRRLREKFD